MDSNYFITGNAIEEFKKISDRSVDLICTDPPYNLGKDYGNNIDWKQWHEYEQFTSDWLTQSKRVLKDTGSIYVFMGVKFIPRLFLMLQELGFHFNGWIIWHYTQGMGRTKGFSPRHEDVLFFTKSNGYTFNLDEVRIPQKYFRERNNMKGANPGDVWEFSHVHYSNPERAAHPTQKPEALMKRIILASSNRGDIVLDPFVGSGTTCVVANFLGIKWIGFDINPEYINMSEKRIKKEINMLDSFDSREVRIPKDLKNDHSQSKLID